MDENKLVPKSKYEERNAKRRALVQKCVEDPYDMDSLAKLFALVHPLAGKVLNEHPRRLPPYDREEYMQIADIVVWRVIEKIRTNPDIINNFEGYVIVSIRNAYITEFRKYVFKSLVMGKSFDRPGDSFNTSYMASYEGYIQRIITQRNETRRLFRKNNLELVRSREREYWSKNKDKKSAKDRRYRESHKEQLQAKQKEYRATHKEQRNAHDRQYRADHLEETRKKRNEYYEKTKEHQRAYRKAYDDAHRDVLRARSRAYYEKNKEMILAKGREYKRKKRAEAKAAREAEKGEKQQ